MARVELAKADAVRIFRDEIWPEVSGPGATTADEPQRRGTDDPSPKATFIVAAPAHLKSTLQSTLQTQASVDADAFAAYHPAYEQLALTDDRSAHLAISRDINRWHDLSMYFVMQQELDVVVSGWSPGAVSQMTANGWDVEVISIAGDAAICDLRRLNRYVQQREDNGYGRWVTYADYQVLYREDPKLISAIYSGNWVQRITVLDRSLQPVITRECSDDSGWDDGPDPGRVLDRLRKEPWGPAEFEEAYRLIDQLRSSLPEDLLPELHRAIQTAETIQNRSAHDLTAEANQRQQAVDRGEGPAVQALGPHATPELLAQAEQTDQQAVADLQQQAVDFTDQAATLGELAADLNTEHGGQSANAPAQTITFLSREQVSLQEWHPSYSQSP